MEGKLMEISSMTISEIQQVQEIATIAWHTTYEGLIALDVQNNYLKLAYNEEMLFKRCTSTPFYVAKIDNKTVGFANFTNRRENGDVELAAIYLHPNYQNQGIGSALLNYGIEQIQPARVWINVEAENEIGKRFYLAKGFEFIEEFDDLFEGYLLKTIRMALRIVQTSSHEIKIVQNTKAIIHVIHAAFKRYEQDPVPSSALKETANSIEEELANGLLIFGVYKMDQLVGIIKCERKKDSLYFSRLSVLPEMQGQGIASALVEHIEKYAKTMGLQSVICKVRKSEQANIQLYEKLGYYISSEEMTTSKTGNTMPTVTMEKILVKKE